MGTWSRRAVLELAAGMSALSLLGCKKKRDAAPTRGGSASGARTAPRYVVQIVLGGGIDSILTTDPRTPAEIAEGIDLPYQPDQIAEAGNARLGPSMAALARVTHPISIINGVALHTANHHTGFEQLVRLRTRVDQRLPSLAEVIGANRPDIPLPGLSVGQLQRHDYSPGWFDGTEVLDDLEGMDGRDIALLAEELAAHARALRGDTRASAQQTAANVEQVSKLLGRLPQVTPPRFGFLGDDTPMARVLERGMWALENDLAAGLYLKVARFEWDTHNHNLVRQTSMMAQFLPLFIKFLDALAQIENSRGRLLDQTLVVAASEIGRFPRVNGGEGKDHFPEAPVLMCGAGLGPHTGCEVFGATGREMEAHPVDPATGRRLANGHVVTLDDIGASVLTMAGISPEPYGYRGRPLPFLVGGEG